MGYHDSSPSERSPAQRIVIRLARRVKVKLRRLRRDTKDKGLATRCQIVLLAAKGRRRADIAESLGRSVSWANCVVARYDACGIAGLYDRRSAGEQRCGARPIQLFSGLGTLDEAHD